MTDLTPHTAPTTQLVPVFQANVGGQLTSVCDGRNLHAFLGAGKRFPSWIQERIERYGFLQDQDFALISRNGETNAGRGGDRRSKDYLLTLDMAKELSMVENNPQGRQARRYFIEMERRALEQAAQVMPAALPTPTNPITPEVRAAINRRAHALSLRHYDRLREDLLEAVIHHLERFPQDTDPVTFVERVDTPDCALVPVHRSDLWWITTRVAAMEKAHRDAMDAIHALEAATGSRWYTRPLGR